MSRSAAKRQVRGRSPFEETSVRGVEVMAAGSATVAEEMPEADEAPALRGESRSSSRLARSKDDWRVKG